MSTPLDYDQILYPSVAHSACHSRRHEAVARLFGMNPTPLPKARVLEVGCGDGWSLFPQAEQYPDAQFVGFDYAARPIENGHRVIDELGLKNVGLRHADIMQVDASWGKFDYIVAHGFFCWVPMACRNKLLELLGQLLAPQGVAYISYNTLPGWRTRQTVRDFMRLRASAIDEPVERVKAARQAFDLLMAGAQPEGYRTLLAAEHDMVKHRPGSYLFHDHLSEINEAFYFSDMVKQIASAGLKYLGDTDLASMYPAEFAPEVRKHLASLSVEEAAQCMDYFRNCEFRSTLFCREEVTLDRNIGPARLLPFHVSLTTAAECSRRNVADEVPLLLRTSIGELQVDDPLRQAAALELVEAFPGGYHGEELLRRTRARLTDAGWGLAAFSEAIAQNVLGFVWHLTTIGVIELAIHPPQLASQVSGQPRASKTARYQAEHGAAHAINQKHHSIWLDAAYRRLLSLCDGEYSSAAIIAQLAKEIEAGEIAGTAREMSQMQAVMLLDRMAAGGLLIG